MNLSRRLFNHHTISIPGPHTHTHEGTRAKLADLCYDVISGDCTIKVHMGVITPYNGPQTTSVSQYGWLQWKSCGFSSSGLDRG